MRRLRHLRIAGAVALGAVGIGAFVLAYFEPQKLFVDDKVAEALPAAASVRTLSAGTFRSHEHATSGRCRDFDRSGRSRRSPS